MTICTRFELAVPSWCVLFSVVCSFEINGELLTCHAHPNFMGKLKNIYIYNLNQEEKTT